MMTEHAIEEHVMSVGCNATVGELQEAVLPHGPAPGRHAAVEHVIHQQRNGIFCWVQSDTVSLDKVEFSEWSRASWLGSE
jgi:hypothetical protein